MTVRGLRQSFASYGLAMGQTLPEPAERKPRAKPVRRETPAQEAVVSFIERCVPGALVHANMPELARPNSKKQDEIARYYNRLARSGLKFGMPDLMIFTPGLTAFIEMKAPGWTDSDVRPNQRERIKELRALGYPVDICSSVDDARSFLLRIGVRTLEAA